MLNIIQNSAIHILPAASEFCSEAHEQTGHSSCNGNIHLIQFINSLMALQPSVGPWPLLKFCNLFLHGRQDPSTGVQLTIRLLLTHSTTQTQNKHTHTHKTSMPRMGFKPINPAFKQVKKVHTFNCANTVIGMHPIQYVPLVQGTLLHSRLKRRWKSPTYSLVKRH
jgi:hypothetical protein